jgi:hypothetical protein
VRIAGPRAGDAASSHRRTSVSFEKEKSRMKVKTNVKAGLIIVV